jgi:hypothetical protein
MQSARAHCTPLCFPFRPPLTFLFFLLLFFSSFVGQFWSPVWLQVKVKKAHARMFPCEVALA